MTADEEAAQRADRPVLRFDVAQPFQGSRPRATAHG